jgi:hypothetical protein
MSGKPRSGGAFLFSTSERGVETDLAPAARKRFFQAMLDEGV